jgi:acetyl-CoA carboxylase carboxyl transferase subunit alpha
VIDGIIKEPEGGAHRDLALTGARIKTQILTALKELSQKSPDALRDERFDKFLKMGAVVQ